MFTLSSLSETPFSTILNPFGQRSFPLGGNKLSKSSVVGVHGNLYADLKDILAIRRPRTLNEWDNMSVWCDLLQWRNEMYNAVIDAFKDHRQIPLNHPHLHYLLYQRHLSPYLEPLRSEPAPGDQKLRRSPWP
jgi:hypothetical protein